MKYLEMKKKAILSIVGKVKGFVRSVSGTPPIALEACADNMSIIDYKIHGNSIQDGTPSPDNPVEVQSVGEKTKNLFDEKLLLTNSKVTKTDNGYKLAGYPVTYDSSSSLIKHIKSVLKPNVTYTLSRYVSGYVSDAIGAIWIRSSSGNLVQVPSGGGIKSAKFTFTQEQIDSIYNIYIYGRNTSNPNGIFHYIQLEEGEVATDYEPYGYKIPVTARSKNYCNPIITGGLNANGKCSIDNKGIVSWKRTSVNAGGGVMLKTFLKAGTYDFTIKIFNVSGYSPINSHILLYLRNNLKFSNGSSVSYGKSTLVVTEDSYIGFNVYSKEPNSEIAIGNSCSWSIMITDNGISGEDYEPYHEPITTNIYLDEPLRKVGDYADYIDFKNSMVVRNIYERIITYVGSIYKKLPNVVRFGSSHGEPLAKPTYTISSTLLTNVGASWYTDKENIFHHNTLGTHYYFSFSWSRLGLTYDGTNVYRNGDEVQTALRDSEILSIAKEYILTISEEDRKVYMILNTPTQTPISLPILPTFKGLTIIYEVGTTIQPSNMEAEYYSTLKGE